MSEEERFSGSIAVSLASGSKYRRHEIHVQCIQNFLGKHDKFHGRDTKCFAFEKYRAHIRGKCVTLCKKHPSYAFASYQN